MKRLLWLGMFSGGLYAASLFSPLSVSYNGIVHAESEQTPGKENNSSFPAESNRFATFYSDLSANYDFSNAFFLSLGGKANVVLGEEPYVSPIYLRGKQTSDQLDKAIVSTASATYDDGFAALSAGRMEISYDWLLGSMDGVIASVGRDDALSLRLFWFDTFNELQYNYAFELKHMNGGRGMYGAIGKMKHGGFDLTVYDYYMQGLRNMAGAHLAYTGGSVGINLSYTSSRALAEAQYQDNEQFAEASVEWLYGHHLFELGGSLTGKNGLLAMIQLGSFMFGQFYLSNQVDRENARNSYMRYIYGAGRWRWEILGGTTGYDNRYVRIENGLRSYEADGYVGYTVNRAWSLQAGAMWMQVDERDPIGVDQTLISANVVYRYDYF